MLRKRAALVPPGARIDYKETDLLLKLLTPQGKILPRRRIGCDAKTQHRIRQAIHRARFVGLLPYGA